MAQEVRTSLTSKTLLKGQLIYRLNFAAILNTPEAEFARLIGVSPMRISHVVRGVRPVTAELALLFGRAFGQSAEYWLNLQSAHDLSFAARVYRRRILSVHPLVPA